MKISTFKKFNIKISKIWFYNKKEKFINDSDVIQLYGIKDQINGLKGNVQYSLYIDLTKNENEIFNNFKKTVKYDINKSENDGVKIEYYDSKELKNNKKIIDTFEIMYNQMYEEKGLKTKLSRDTFESYIDSDMAILSKVSKDNTDIIYHVYLADDNCTRFLYSCSNFRSDDQNMKNIIGRANKSLHWNDIKYFKQKNLKIYDLGGVRSFNNPNGIDLFKMSFGGEKIVYYNYEYANTIKGKIYLFLKTAFIKIFRKN